MRAKAMKLITVPKNGQISIGTRWAGKQIRIEELSENEIHISAGTFVPDSQKEFFTESSIQRLKEFDQWIEGDQKPIFSWSARARRTCEKPGSFWASPKPPTLNKIYIRE